MAKLLRSFRSKMIGMFGLSLFLSGVITYIIYKLLQYYYHHYVDFGDPLAQLRRFILHVGDVNFFLIIFIPLSILFFYLLTKRYSTYFNEISKGIHSLARGDFGHHVDIQTSDEFQDIATDINLASKHLKEAIEKGEFSESSKNQLVVNLAHDLRTPLTSVLGYLDLVLHDDTLTDQQVKHYLTIAYTKSRRLEKLIDELFEITRLNYGMLPITKNEINLSELLHQLNEELYPVFESNELTTRMNVSPDLYIDADGELLVRVFENLLLNAVRYGSDGQYVDINSFELSEHTVAVQIINYGSEIPPEDLPHLFDIFYTGDRARTHQKNSSGLGLFIAKNIVEQHSGTINVQSNAIRTMFEVRLPRKI